ncbi:alpha/beta hydrolase [Bifidobacterium sp. LC6]|uniref:Alpha/beta hydrolase n=1 Tax=Bifidobacterium colobi TaxID=2809026 RepID=A0ABS5UWA9_9BIFI|nr:GPI inositol-deacylase [Bifidobacterium colobi]MBT1174986.1 alpha/beta hydrolase [Bifidobacterium colobi]
MSENDYYWQVESSVYGGTGYAPATLEEYTAIARALDDEASALAALATSWSSAALQLQAHRTSAPMCPALSAGEPLTATAGHTTVSYTVLGARCQEHAAECTRLSSELSSTASLLIRAHALYSDAELSARRIFTESVQAGVQFKPKHGLIGTAAVAIGGLISGWVIEGKPNPTWMSTSTYPFQEGVMSGLGSFIGGIALGEGVEQTDEVNQGAGKIANVSGPVKDIVQGNHLEITEVHARNEVVRSSNSVGSALENLRRLGEERLGKINLNSGLEYGTIAVQRYQKADGSNAWLVTIPGTDGKKDSPFGWEQNVELMSSDKERRMRADSVRMVTGAMEQAGIGKDEPVALIGHSQGGIVAATIASDWSEDYNIEHVVTAGSPVANHPIPSDTWVTSVEIDDELVGALDGAANPATENWLTVRGHVSPAPAASASTVNADGSCTPGATPIYGATSYDAAPVAGGATNGRELSHWLKYHQAAYQNATDLGSPAVQRHESHFQSVIDGELKETRYFQGRMTSSTTQAPADYSSQVQTFEQ